MNNLSKKNIGRFNFFFLQRRQEFLCNKHHYNHHYHRELCKIKLNCLGDSLMPLAKEQAHIATYTVPVFNREPPLLD